MFQRSSLRSYKALTTFSVVFKWIQWIALALLFGIYGYVTVKYKDNNNGYLEWIVIIFVTTKVVRHILVTIARAKLYQSFSRSFSSLSATSLDSPLLTKNALSYTQEGIAEIPVGNKMGTLSRVAVIYSTGKGKDRSTQYSLSYLVLAIPLAKKVPHIFIDGRKQNIFSFRNRNLWSLTKKVSRQAKLQALEGDFYTYFDVYTPAKKELETLSILTPDTMLALRDKGFEFDYELYGNHLFVISEPNLTTPGAYEAYLGAATATLTELIPQITKHTYSEPYEMLPLIPAKLTAWALLYSALGISFYLGWIIILFTYAYAVGVILSLATSP